MQKLPRMILACVALAVCAGGSFVQAEEWGTLTGRFVVKGDLPAPAKIDIQGKDPDVSGKVQLVHESVTGYKEGWLDKVLI